ncbi:hypothetical protein JOB18_016477 [Solea senegalensis]|uniref:Leucine-rich repeat-containing protein 41 n=1 Tax=Solea senegalensis TaxID=28829 RepID=A0AAV6S8Q5_SOLSE|nr:uncharacterized protein lrrc41 [Solea senegalensis]KAG7513779.1 hypothetical protein JOB18_016477 [Solea senegalensis]
MIREPKETGLQERCFYAVREHFAVLGADAVLDLPAPLIETLLPYLTVCQLDELQPRLNQRGISTYYGWVRVLQFMSRKLFHTVDLLTEDEVKHEVMRMLFTTIFYGYKNSYVVKNSTNLNTPSFLWTAAKCIRQFVVSGSRVEPLQRLTAEQRPLLGLLEKQIRSIVGFQAVDLSKKKAETALYVVHRLLDHGAASEVLVQEGSPILLAWLLHGRGSEFVSLELKRLMDVEKESSSASVQAAAAENNEVAPCKRRKIDSQSEMEQQGKASLTVDPDVLCHTFSPCDGPSPGPCPRGQISVLEIRHCDSDCLSVLNSALPTFFCLRSLTIHNYFTFSDTDVWNLACALKRLSDNPRSSLTQLNVSYLSKAKLMDVLLDANPRMTTLHLEVQDRLVPDQQSVQHHPRLSEASELSLEKLTLKVAVFQTPLRVVTSLLRRSPRLSSLHIAGLRLPFSSSLSPLLTTLSESNLCLKSLNLEDMNLSDCLPEILHLLRRCKLEELHCNDCRLLEKCSDKEESLQQLVSAVKSAFSLHTLSLAQNRLAKNVCVLAELFSGPSPSSLKRLNLSSNFIQPAELLEFTHRLRTRRPPRRLVLDLKKNPGDRDPDTWNAALGELRPLCVPLVECWRSTNTMAEHVSVM